MRLLMAVMMVLCVAGTAGAEECKIKIERLEAPAPFLSPLGGEEKQGGKLLRLAAYAAIDYGQSVEAFYHREGHGELNPLLNERPTRREMIRFGVAGIALAWLAGEILPEAWGQVVIDSALASESMNIEENARVLEHGRREMEAIPIIISLRW